MARLTRYGGAVISIYNRSFDRQLFAFMKLRSFTDLCWLFALLLLGQTAITSHAQTVADLAGTWHGFSYNTPGPLTLTKNGQNLVTDISPLIGTFEFNDNTIAIAANGTFTGSVNGSIVMPNTGTAVATTTPDNDVTTFHINRSNDVMVAVKSGDGESQDMVILVKAPTSVTTTELGGTWNVFSFSVPGTITLSRADGGFPGVVTSVQGADGFKVRSGSLTINGANGNITGSLEGPFTGQVQGFDSGTGHMNVSITPSGESAFTLPLYINQSKDVMIVVQGATSPDDNYQEINVFVRAPASTPGTGNFKGYWRLSLFDTPSVLTPVTDGNGHLTELNNRDAFEVSDTQEVTIGNDTFFTGRFDEPVIGNISVAAPNQLTIMGTHPDNSTDGATLYVNAGLNFLVAVQTGGYNQELIFGIRAPQGNNTTKPLGLMMFKGKAYWAADTTRKLQTTGDVTLGGWADVTGTTAAHTFTPLGTTNQYFRVVEP